MSDLIDDWRSALNSKLSVAEAILFEAKLATAAGDVAALLPHRMTYLKTLHTARERASIALYDYAREVNWRRPVLFAQALRVARGYLRDVVGHADLTSSDRRKEFTGRLGVATVLISRFSDVSQPELQEAMDALHQSLAEGNNPKTAVPYLIEAAVAGFDLNPDPAVLWKVLQEAREYLPGGAFEANAAGQLAVCDAYLRLASLAGPSGRKAALAAAAQCVHRAKSANSDTDDRVRILMLETVIRALTVDPSQLDGGATIGLRLPFGTRVMNPPALLRRLATELTESLVDRARDCCTSR